MDLQGNIDIYLHIHSCKFSFTHSLRMQNGCKRHFRLTRAEGASQKVKLDHIHLISEDFNPRWAQTNHQESQADQGFILCLQRHNQMGFFCVCVCVSIPQQALGRKAQETVCAGNTEENPSPNKERKIQGDAHHVVWENLR